jgi:hypothetical protein
MALKRKTTIRKLPETFVLTKTHCGGRCVNCNATEYVVDATGFANACLKTSGYRTVQGKPGAHFIEGIEPARVDKVIHLIRNPFHNIVARYHLERRHLVEKDVKTESLFPNNATGFQRWCKNMDEKYGGSSEEEAGISAETLAVMRQVPCRAEFFKYMQWHNRLAEFVSSSPFLGASAAADRVLIVHYEDYEQVLNKTVDRIMSFLQQRVVLPLRPFRALPTYADHYSADDRQAAKELAIAMTIPEVYELIRHYF